MTAAPSITARAGDEQTPMRPVGEFKVKSRGSVDPRRFPDELFELFSIPAYDSRKPEVVHGKDIGSSKKVVEPGDVLISRIVPHIQRVWVVGASNGKRQIASGEWLVYGHTDVDQEYLRYMLLSTPFHQQFMDTVAGMGGSLMRARPSEVDRIEIPFPKSLTEQRRIAAILDKADAIRRKREQALTLADDFLKSVFLEMFGDQVLNPKNYSEVRLDEIAEINSGITKGRKAKPDEALRSVPYMRVANVQDSRLEMDEIKEIEATEKEIAKFLLRKGDLLLTEGGDPDKLGRGCVWNDEIPESIHQNHIFKVRLTSKVITPLILQLQIGSPRGKHYFLKAAKQTTGIASINKRQLSAYPVLIPDAAHQSKYEEIVAGFWPTMDKLKRSVQEAGDLFNSLSQRAFSGEL